MSFGNSADSTGGAAFKKFVSEDELEEKRKKRQEEWEKVRKPDEPLEAPEEKYDGRCLYDKLAEQKQKKQDEYDDLHRLSNQVKGLDDDEAEFLDFVSEKQQEITKKREDEETEILQEYRSAMTNQVTDMTAGVEAKAKLPSRPSPSTTGTGAKKSQLSLLAGAVKRKSQDEVSSTSGDKKLKTDSTTSSAALSETSASETTDTRGAASVHSTSNGNQVARVIGVLPGLGCYDNSSDSDSDSSDSDIELPKDVFQKKTVVCQSNT